MRSTILVNLLVLASLSLMIANVHSMQSTPRFIPGYEKFKAERAKAQTASQIEQKSIRILRHHFVEVEEQKQ